jgi:hypothetical protein
VIWVVVYHDVVAVPQPIAGVVKVIRRDAPEKAAKPETVPTSAFEAINVIAANFTAEASVFPYVILMITSIVAASAVTDPLVAVSMHVGSFGMALLVAIGWARLFTTSRAAAATCIAALWLSASPVRGWPVSGYVTAANLRAAAGAAAGWMLTAATSSLLGKRRQRQNQKNCKQTR